jgi:hypothetical protein
MYYSILCGDLIVVIKMYFRQGFAKTFSIPFFLFLERRKPIFQKYENENVLKSHTYWVKSAHKPAYFPYSSLV